MNERPLYVAFTQVEYKRNMQTMDRYTVIADDPGPAHVLDVGHTKEGDPWRRLRPGSPRRPRPHFYKGRSGPSAPCGAVIRVVVPLTFNADDPDACPECAQKVREGKAWRRDPWGPLECRERLTTEEADVYECGLAENHKGAHVDLISAVRWDRGSRDYYPEPDGYV